MKHRLLSGFISVIAISILILPHASFGVSSKVLDAGGVGAKVTDKTGLGNTSVTDATGNVINIVLGFLAVIAVVLCLYAGFLWMTAAGDEEKITKAKDILKAAVIGLIIIFIADGISLTVIYYLNGATGGGLDFSKFL
jgi:hypothetical protein